jgi:hypothetical protein
MKVRLWSLAAAITLGLLGLGCEKEEDFAPPRTVVMPPPPVDPEVRKAERFDAVQTWAWTQERSTYRQWIQAALDESGRWSERVRNAAEGSDEPTKGRLVMASDDLETQRGRLLRDLVLIDNNPIDTWPQARAQVRADLDRTRSSLQYAIARLQS